MSFFEQLARPLLFRMDAEAAHGLSIAALRCGLPFPVPPPTDSRLGVHLCGLDFPNPLGIAAGYDKNGEVPDALLALGFGFAEIGSVTPLPQAGNPKPRIFRLPADHAVINRLGFNNQGHDFCAQRLVARKGRGGIVGVNIGANKDSGDRVGDYEIGVKRFAPLASYLTVNISSPNTPGLRALQGKEELAELLTRVMATRAALPDVAHRARPIFLKIAPDLTEVDLEDVAAAILRHGVDGIIVSNTTLSRAGLRALDQASESGGLSGRPLFERSTIVLAKVRQLLGKEVAIIGVGGIDSAKTAIEKIRAGADLVQFYTGLVYGGPGLPRRILSEIARTLDAEGTPSITALRDTHCGQWAAKNL